MTKALKQFEANLSDVDNLMGFHADHGGQGPGRRDKRLEVLNKSAVVLITAIWEAYCEDVAEEALEHIVQHAADSSKLSKPTRQVVAKELKADKNELAVWELADGGWRDCLRGRFERMREDRNRKLNTPKAAQIDALFEQALGLNSMSRRWYWSGMSVENARTKLDKFVSLRGAIAHRGSGSNSCKKSDVTNYRNHVERLVAKTDMGVRRFARTNSGRALR